MKKILAILASVIVVAGAFFAIFLNGNSGSSKEIKVGIIGADDRVWKVIQSNLKKQNINIKLVKFTDYNQPNQALADGSIDLNAYQHQYFLDNWNDAHKTNLTSIGDTIIAPLAIYSDKIKDISEIKAGDEISIPNDATNEARALQVLEEAGIIKLKADVKLPTPNDIESYTKQVKITPLDASQTARSLNDVAVAVINNSTALDAGLNVKDAIYTEKITEKSKPWINIIAVQEKDKNNKTYKKILKAYQTKEIADKLEEVYKGSTLPAWDYKF